MSDGAGKGAIVDLQGIADLGAVATFVVDGLPTMILVMYFKYRSAPTKFAVKLQKYLIKPAVEQRQRGLELFAMASAIGQSKTMHQVRQYLLMKCITLRDRLGKFNGKVTDRARAACVQDCDLGD